jgi:ribosomal protein L7/L12
VTNKGDLPDDVFEALENGQTIEAIKLLRAATGLGLKETKDMIDAYQRGEPVSVSMGGSFDQLPASVLSAIQSGNKIEAIKLLREQTGLGLKEAKDAVEAMTMPKPGVTRHFPTVEKPASGSTIRWLLVVAALGFAGYYFFKS